VPPGPLELAAHAIVADASELVASAAVKRLAKCAGARCGWLFLDKGKNHARRWCSMGAAETA